MKRPEICRVDLRMKAQEWYSYIASMTGLIVFNNSEHYFLSD